jgi:hypothetical protein
MNGQSARWFVVPVEGDPEQILRTTSKLLNLGDSVFHGSYYDINISQESKGGTMATKLGARAHHRAPAYDAGSPMPSDDYQRGLEPFSARDWRTAVAGADLLTVLSGIWLIISPFVLGYSGADAVWNPIVFGAIAGSLALLRLAGGELAASLAGLPLVNAAIGVWLFISAFWLADSAQASWNVGVMGVVLFILGVWGAASPARS